MSFKLRSLAWGCVVAGLTLVGVASQAAQVVFDFELLGLAAPQIGTPVVDTFKSQGLTFGAGANAFHSGTDANAWTDGPPTHSGSFGFVSNSVGQGFTIQVVNGFNFSGLTMDYAVSTQSFEIKVVSRADNTGAVTIATRDVIASPSGWVWTENDEIAKSGFGMIDHVEFNPSGGFLAIDNLRFIPNDPGAGVPEPAGLGLVALALVSAGIATRRRKAI